jgi:hypothetical protein
MTNKRFLLSIFAIFLAVAIMLAAFIKISNAQTWHTTDQVTLAWDAPTSLSNGDPVPSEDEIRYRIFLADAVSDPSKTSPVELTPDNDGDGTLDPILDKSKTITVQQEGRYFFGVKALRYHDANGDGNLEQVGESAIAWSDNSEYVQDGTTFGVEHFFSITEPSGLMKQ